MDHIRDVLNAVIGDLEQKDKKEKRYIFNIWDSVVGEEIAKHTKLQKMKGNKLFVIVDHATWAYELTQRHKPVLIKRINDALGSEKIENIYFKIGDIS